MPNARMRAIDAITALRDGTLIHADTALNAIVDAVREELRPEPEAPEGGRVRPLRYVTLGDATHPDHAPEQTEGDPWEPTTDFHRTSERETVARLLHRFDCEDGAPDDEGPGDWDAWWESGDVNRPHYYQRADEIVRARLSPAPTASEERGEPSFWVRIEPEYPRAGQTETLVARLLYGHATQAEVDRLGRGKYPLYLAEPMRRVSRNFTATEFEHAWEAYAEDPGGAGWDEARRILGIEIEGEEGGHDGA